MTPSHFVSRTALGSGLLLASLGCASAGAPRQEGVGTQQAVTAEDMARNTGRPIEEVLQAKVPGLVVSRTSEGHLTLQIRGTSSFMSNNQPLYVIDDVPVTPGPGGALIGLNPHDIETIRVLKDPADTGIYGMRGANGVVVVTTRKGKRGT